MTATAWKPADQIDQIRICAGPGCTREFRPRRWQDTYCSERCAARSAAAAVIDDSAPALRQTDPPELHDGGSPALPAPAAAEPEPGDAPAATPPPPDGRRPCSNPGCAKQFAPGRGWRAKYCCWACMRAVNPPKPKPTTITITTDVSPAPPAREVAGFAEGHHDGFCSGVEAAAELAITLMASPTFRALGPEVARAVICEVYAPMSTSHSTGGGR
jgi:hypothetical protein